MPFDSASPFVSLFIESDGLLAEVGHEIELGLMDGHILSFKRGKEYFHVDLLNMSRYSKAESQCPDGVAFCIFKLEFHQTSVILLAEEDLRNQIEAYMSYFFGQYFNSMPYHLIDNWRGKTFDKFLLILENEYNLVLGLNETGVMGLVPKNSSAYKEIKELTEIAPMFPHFDKFPAPDFLPNTNVPAVQIGWKYACPQPISQFRRKDSDKENAV